MDEAAVKAATKYKGVGSAEYQREWRKKNPGKASAYVKAWRAKQAKAEKPTPAQKSVAARKQAQHYSNLLRKYRITRTEYDELLKSQKGKCAVCRRVSGAAGRRLCVDHCHVTNTIRGLLCGECNIGLGMFRDDPELVQTALSYLHKHAKTGGKRG